MTWIVLALLGAAMWGYLRWREASAAENSAPSYARLGGGDGTYSIEVVGESHYLANLRRIAGKGEVRHECDAELWLENDNPHDSNAVQVRVDGSVVGYLARADAKQYRRQLVGHGSVVGRCPAVIIGGGAGRDNLGVWLDLPER